MEDIRFSVVHFPGGQEEIIRDCLVGRDFWDETVNFLGKNTVWLRGKGQEVDQRDEPEVEHKTGGDRDQEQDVILIALL